MLHQIGIGTLGPVFRTYEPSRDRLVAVKAFRLDIVPEQAQALAVALARAADASLSDPSIVEPIAAGLEGTVAYRAEEYVAAESLDVAMRHYAPAAPEKVLPFITQLAGAIDGARAAGIGHGGLHPRDIFVTPDEARATGFGVVDALEQVGIRAPVRRPYSAPERIDGRAWGTPADVFSLAAIAFELLTGKRPSGTGDEIGGLPDGPHAAEMHAVLARAMDEQAMRRFPTAGAFAEALEAASQGRPVIEGIRPAAADDRVRPTQRGREETTIVAPAPLLSVPPAPPAPPPLAETAPLLAAAEFPDASAGEFEVEAALDPVHAALDDVTALHQRDDDAQPEPARVPLIEARDDEMPFDRYVDDFVEEQATEADERSPLEAEPRIAKEPLISLEPRVDTPVSRPAQPPMFGAVAPADAPEAEPSRPAILPYALVAVPALLIGFGGGYFVGSRDRIAPEAAQTAAAPTAATPPPAAGAATSDKPGQYSEQKVAPREPSAPSSSQSAPAIARATPSAVPPPANVSRPTPESRAPAAAQRGQLVIRSQPARAGVTVNGKWRGRTPLTLDRLTFGNYAIRVGLPGYQAAREDVSLSANTPTHTFTARLERATAPPPTHAPVAAPAPTVYTGSLYVDSRPRGATVFVDGKSAGQTPVELSEVRVGAHVVRIELQGKKPVTANPRITAGKTERVTVSLEDKQ